MRWTCARSARRPQRDVLAIGLLLHRMLAGRPALDEPDSGELIAAPAAAGPRTRAPALEHAAAGARGAACHRQPRHRPPAAPALPQRARLQRALDGWLQVDGAAGGGPLALLLDRLHSVGALPSSPGSAARAARLARMDRERTNELAEVVLQDLALSFELLRW